MSGRRDAERILESVWERWLVRRVDLVKLGLFVKLLLGLVRSNPERTGFEGLRVE